MGMGMGVNFQYPMDMDMDMSVILKTNINTGITQLAPLSFIDRISDFLPTTRRRVLTRPLPMSGCYNGVFGLASNHPPKGEKEKTNAHSKLPPSLRGLLLCQSSFTTMAIKTPISILSLLVFSILSLLLLSLSSTFKTPFHPRDILPLLPRGFSWPILKYLHGAPDLLPTFVGAASSTNTSLEWKGACFYENSAWLEFHNESGGEFGGGTLHIKVCAFSAHSGFDFFEFVTDQISNFWASKMGFAFIFLGFRGVGVLEFSCDCLFVGCKL